jgi:hypothetical protein
MARRATCIRLGQRDVDRRPLVGAHIADDDAFPLSLEPMLGQFALLWPCPDPDPGCVVEGDVELDWAYA